MRHLIGWRPALALGLLLSGSLLAAWASTTAGYLSGITLIALGGLLWGQHLSLAPASNRAHTMSRTATDEPYIASSLSQLTHIINSTLELNQVLNLSLEYLAEVVPYDAAVILLTEESGLSIAACRGWPNSDTVITHKISVAENSPVQQVLQTRQPQVIADVRQVDWSPYYDKRPDTDAIRAWMGTPLIAQGQCIGLLIVEKYEPGVYGDREGEIAATFAAQIATAVQNARLFNDIRHRALEVAVMADNINEEKSKLGTILRHIADGLVVTDAEGNIQMVNPAFEQMFSRPGTVLADQSATQTEELERLIGQVLNEQEMQSVTDIELSDGRILRASSGLIAEETRPLGAVIVLRDITREREVDRMKSEFISTVSHELRTPLTSVLGFAQHINKVFNKNIVPRVPLDERKVGRTVRNINEELAIIVNEGERLTRLINDVLDIAKMEAGKSEWHMSEVALGPVIQQAVAASSALAHDKNLPVEVWIEENLPPVQADRDRLIQVATNLLSNAIKFTDTGQVTVSAFMLEIGQDGAALPYSLPPRIQPKGRLEPGAWVVVSVEDTGIGIDEANLPQVFEKFKQVGDVLTDRPQGTGLGVPICKEIVEQHNGHIWAESQLGLGSTFTFALPLAAEALPAPAPTEPQAQPTAPADRNGAGQAGQLILVVDDEANIRNLLRQELSEAGYRVIEADNGLKGVLKARQERPDLIILDVIMPSLNGFDVANVLKGDPMTASIPLLILSIVDDRERIFRLGAAHLTKPLQTAALLQTIRALLARRDNQKYSETHDPFSHVNQSSR